MVQKLLTTNPHNYGIDCPITIKHDLLSLIKTNNKCLAGSNCPYRKIFSTEPRL